MMKVYLDNAATTMVRQEVVDAMIPAFTTYYGNPSSLHTFAREADQLLSSARADVAAVIGAKPDEIVFTGGGSESDNMALRGAVAANKKKGKHVITSAVEHHAVLYTLQAMEREGIDRSDDSTRRRIWHRERAERRKSDARRYGSRLDHVCQQRGRQHQPHFGNRKDLPREGRVVSYRRGAGDGACADRRCAR